MKLVIIRHAEPDYSIDSVTQKGGREAELLSERLKRLDVNKIYCSPLGRAKDTAKPTLQKLGKEAEICDWLKEFPPRINDPYIKEQGRRCWDFMPSFWTKEEKYFDKDNWYNTPLMKEGGVKEEYEKVCKGLDGLLESHGYKRNGNMYEAVKPNSDTILLFCHFGVESIMLSHLLNISPMPLLHGFVALPSSVTALATEEREKGKAYFRCSCYGDLSHLYVADEPPSFAARFCELYTNEDERH
ncbi:MAG: histidine phosphatase family protein [Clostridia bacterium]|nr:histidine phosphatase family protein [Clostridia bacterium]